MNHLLKSLLFFWLGIFAQGQTLPKTTKTLRAELEGKPKICEVRQVYKQGDIEDVTLSCIPDLLAEPIDVPAVQESKVIIKKGERMEGVFCGLFSASSNQDCRAISDISHSTETCADKTRVLLHDESTPPRYFCHKVNTQ